VVRVTTVPALWTKHRDLARSIGLFYKIPGLDVEDRKQEADIALWMASRSYNPELGSFKSWARRVVEAHMLSLLRGATREMRHPSRVYHPVYHPRGDIDPIAQIEAPDPGRQLRALIDLLPELTEIERAAIDASIKGTYDPRNRSQENGLQRAKRKFREAA